MSLLEFSLILNMSVKNSLIADLLWFEYSFRVNGDHMIYTYHLYRFVLDINLFHSWDDVGVLRRERILIGQVSLSQSSLSRKASFEKLFRLTNCRSEVIRLCLGLPSLSGPEVLLTTIVL